MHLTEAAIPGFVWAYQFSEDPCEARRLGQDVTLPELTGQEGFLWLHLALSDARVPAVLDQLPGLTPEARAELTSQDAHAKLFLSSSIVCGTIVDYQRHFDDAKGDIGWLHFAITDKYIVTTRVQPLRSVDRARVSIEKAGRIRGPIDVFAALLLEFQRTVVSIVGELNEELNVIEDAVYEQVRGHDSRRLAPIRRTIARLHRHLRTEIALLRRVTMADDDDVLEGFEAAARHLCERIETAERDVSALQERARLLHEDIDSRTTSETNRHLYILSLFTAFLMPPTLVTGFFGMNVADLPFTHGGGGAFWAVALLLLSVAFAWLLLRRFELL
jgi:zinc transporter